MNPAAPKPRSTVTNNMASSGIVITGATITGPDAADFTIGSDTCNINGSALATGATCTVTVVFKPLDTSATSASGTTHRHRGKPSRWPWR